VAEVALVPSSGGAFEVTLGGEPVYSKLQTGNFPSEGDIVKSIGSKL
jgi:selenoprotein W-related protein